MAENSIAIQLNITSASASKSINTVIASLKKVRPEAQGAADKIGKLSTQFRIANTMAGKLSSGLDVIAEKLGTIRENATFAATNIAEITAAMKQAGNMKMPAASTGIPTENVGTAVTANTEPISETAQAVDEAAQAMESYSYSSQSAAYSSEEYAQAMEQINASMPKESKLSNLKTALSGMFATIRSGVPSVHSMGGAFSKLQSAIGRIAFYRAIRSAIKAVTSAYKEGITNLYYYSQALNNMDASHASGTMNEFATTALYVKNSLGASLMPVLQSLLPIVNAVANLFVAAANAVNQFFHALRGESVFTKAKKYATDFGDALDNASGSAKELKKQIFGFDELNIFNKPSSGGGGGDSGLDYSKMFEEAELSDFFKRIRDTVKKNLGEDFTARFKINFKDVLFNWSDLDPEQVATKMLAGFYGLMGGLAGFAIGGGLGAIVGALLGVSFAVFISTINFNGDGKLSSDEVASMIRDVCLTLTGAIIGYQLGGLKGALIGMEIGMSLTALIKTFAPKAGTTELTVAFMGMLIGVMKALVKKNGVTIGGGAVVGNPAMAFGIALVGGILLTIASLADLKNELGDQSQFIGTAIAEFLNLAAGAAIGFAFGGVPGAAIGITVTCGLNLLINKVFTNYTPQSARELDRLSNVVDLSEMNNYLGSPSSGGNNMPKSVTRAEGRASGGTVEAGTYFYAGENGNPELIGTFGGRVNVTNQSQFTAGMVDIMDNTNTVILQAAQALISAINNKDMTVINTLSDRAIVNAYDRGKRLGGTGLATGSGIV